MENSDYIAMKELLDEWSGAVAEILKKIGRQRIKSVAPDLSIYIDGIGFRPPKSSSEIAKKERILGISLPPDYFSFLSITDGWPVVDFCQSTLVGVEKIGLYSSLYPESYGMWREPYAGSAEKIQRGVYGPDQLPELYAPEDLDKAIAVSDNNESECVLLNPSVSNGKYWETWLISPKIPGAMRFPSFFCFMHYAFTRVEETLDI